MDNQKIRETPVIEHLQEQEWDPRKANNKLLFTILGSLVLLTLVVLFFVISSTSHYEKGVQYLQQKQYNQSLVEFQKVEPDDKDFKMAQSKINYISGLRAFNDNLRPQAITFLSKVDPADEYYHESQLMLDKLKFAENKIDLESLNGVVQNLKDTVIIKEKVIEKSPAEGQPNDTYSQNNIDRSYVNSVDYLINSFRSMYQSAGNVQGVSKREIYKNMDSVYNELLKTSYPGKEKNSMLSELHNLASNWMQKSLNYINSQLVDNTVSGESNNSKYKSDEEKAYSLLVNQLNKVKSFYSI